MARFLLIVYDPVRRHAHNGGGVILSREVLTRFASSKGIDTSPFNQNDDVGWESAGLCSEGIG